MEEADLLVRLPQSALVCGVLMDIGLPNFRSPRF